MSLDTSVSTVAGATLLGAMFSALLYGVISLQSFNYFSLSEKDPAFIRLTVAVLWGLNTLHQAFIMHMAYTYAIVDFGNVINASIWSVPAQILTAGIIAFIVRCLFLIRVMKLSGKNWYLMMPPLLSIVMSAASTIVLSAQEVDLVNPTYWLVFVALGCDVVSDILLSSTLAVLLHNLKTGIRATDTVIRAISVYGVSIAILTSTFSIACLTTFALMSNTLVYMALYFMLPKLLTSALLAGYNSREHLREAVNNAGEMISISIIFSDPHEPRQHAGTVALQPTNYGDKPNIR